MSILQKEPNMTFTCPFSGCSNPALPSGKCEVHKNRAKCEVEDCLSQAYARNACVKHGGRQKCQLEGCTSNVCSQGFCCKHGPGNNKNICQVEGCMKAAHARQRCVRHGGGKKCTVDECTKFARSFGVWYHHGGVRQSKTSEDPNRDDDDILAYILDDLAKMDVTNVDALLAETCNCDFDFTEEEHQMLNYFITS
ncbi:hypothetical protein AC1031_016984 [Aphanomyces cochlioides]|nr:hypothetical protein AC1031_016984 [Aphanomyces cochlioides]